ncbi:flagellar hook-associated protein FlgK [Aquisalimonas sp. 2447]|uniref:flagellar hook-associated protein FlgK n=1 Tax=Aquisalimonas sp. 2447 TaxID=2740807 RepID=UPI0014327463|nr:flagellar hook-associated protein FlgK [Aquisalimonas sp. 2447]QIT56167.1 flagellar hook-associated protein FlgK [Aquisalimonas sp. 2447]
MADILGTSVSGLQAFQRALATTSHNISNVNTEGYSRQRAEFETRPPTEMGNGFIGNGVETGTVRRLFDQNLENALRQAGGDFEEKDTLANYAGRIDNLLADKEAGLSPALQGFFDSIQDVANDPASSSAREVALAQADNLVSRFDLLDRRFRDLDSEVNNQLASEVEEINQYAESIASLNREIREAEGRTGQPANDLLDQRDLQIRKLSEKVGTQIVAQDDGAVNVFVGSGQPLVTGNSANELAVERNEYDPGRSEIAFAGGSSNQTITSTLSGGSIGGMLEFRDEILNPARNELGQLATGMTDAFNAQHRQGIQPNGNQGEDFFRVGEPRVLPSSRNSEGLTGTPEVAIIEDASGELTGNDYRLTYDGPDDGGDDAANWTVTNLGTGSEPEPLEAVDGMLRFDGLEVDVGDLAEAEDGDSFEIQPTRDAALGMGVELRNANQIAAAAPVTSGEVAPGGQAGNSGSGEIADVGVTSGENVPFGEEVRLFFEEGLGADEDQTGFTIEVFDSDADGGEGGFEALLDNNDEPVFFPFNPAEDNAGETFSGDDLSTDFDLDEDENPLAGVEFTMAGAPDVGDSFFIAENQDASGDNRNAQKLAAVADEGLLNDGNDSPQDFFSAMVGQIGTDTQRAQSARDAQESLLRQAEADRESVSGVNLEEEAANMLRFQQGFQAAARVTAVADEVFQSLLGAIQR